MSRVSGPLLLQAVRALAAAFALATALVAGPGPEGVRARWTTSRFHGSPDPAPPYRVEVAFPGLRFTQPVLLASAPGTGRLFVAEQGGKVWSFREDPRASTADLALDVALETPGANVYGLAFHPKFEENRRVFLCYVLPGAQPEGTRVSRFTVRRGDPPAIDPRSEEVVITWLSGGHNGGCLEFGPDALLYISTGDATEPSPPDRLDTGQDLSDLLSSILRIDVDRTEEGRRYAVPRDNPFVGVRGARPEIWAYGFRNPWKMSFDRATGDLLAGDVGWEMWEMVHRVVRGGNYGWSVMEGRQAVRPGARRGPTPILPPLADHPHPEAASVTGGIVYRGGRLEEIRGAYVYGDYATGTVWALRHAKDTVTWRREIARTALHLVAFGEGAAEELYLLDHEPTGQVYRLAPNAPTGPEAVGAGFPQKLSETGLFADVKGGVPASGVIPYVVQAEPWWDGALAERFLALPGDATIDDADPESWKLPDGTVLAKTLSAAAADAPGAGRRRVETQVLHLEAGAWRFYTYAWNDEETGAALVGAAGLSRGGWRFASRAECALCHNPWAGSVLGVNALQLHRRLDLDGGGSQLRAWERLGLFSRPLPGDLERRPRLADPRDASAGLDARARSYLHVNCSHCHRFGAGGTALIDLTLPVALEKMQAVGVAPVQGAFGIEGARIVAPGDPCRSVLYCRMAKLGGGHMPRAGPREADEEGVELIEEWIASLGSLASLVPTASGGPVGPFEPELCRLADAAGGGAARAETIAALLASAPGALVLAARIGRGGLPPSARGDVLAAVKRGATPEIRDLFERFLPPGERRRLLGAAARPEEILALKGDPARGKDLFSKGPSAQCRTCHTAQGEGVAVGPDLSRIGAKYTPAQILDQTLDPSREVAPEYAAYVLVTTSGQVLTGLIAEKSEKDVALRDAKGAVTRVPAGEVRTLERQERSLMPDLLLQDLTAEEAADLVAYLAGLKG